MAWCHYAAYKGEFENEKAAPYLLLNPAFPESYLKAVLEKESQYRYVLIPTIPPVLRMLREDCGIRYILCYPQISLVAEYEERYRRRGNGKEFMDIFIGQWDERISSLMEETYGQHIRLGEGEYLSDVKERIDEMIVLGSAGCEDVKRREKKLAELKEYVDCVMEQTLYDHQYDSDPHYIQEAESREAVMQLMFDGKTQE